MEADTTKVKIEKLKKQFDIFSTWEEKYKHIIDMGRTLEPLEESLKTDQILVKGCQSQVWLKPELVENKVLFKGASDSVIVQGLLALILSVYSDEEPEAILATPPIFLEELGLKKHLTPNRANGVYAMVKQILLYAQAFKLLRK